MNDEVMKVKISEHDGMLKEHGKRLDKIEQDSAEFRVHIKNLCKKIDELTGWLKAFRKGLFFGGDGTWRTAWS